MASNPTLFLRMNSILEERGKEAQEKAIRDILNNFKDNSQISQALRYFAKGALGRGLPVFPALVSIACEAAGGKSETAIQGMESLVLITGAADLHDDIIDHSLAKGPNKTVFGKFGLNVTILVGDILLVKGLEQLNKQLDLADNRQSRLVRDLVTSGVVEISKAETKEYQLRKKGFEISSSDYLKIIRQKGVVPEIAMRIGATLGNGNLVTINGLGRFGRTYAFVTTILDEFIDVLEFDELKNRLESECPPLPIVYLLQNHESEQTIRLLLRKDFDENAHEIVIEFVKNSPDVKRLQKTLALSIKKDLQKMKLIANGKALEQLETLLLAPMSYLSELFP